MKIRHLVTSMMLCSLPFAGQAATMLTGFVAAETPWPGSGIEIIDSLGTRISTVAGNDGHYQVDISNLTAPVLISATWNSPSSGESPQDCLNNDTLRGRCMASVRTSLTKDTANIANITPFTDRIVSEIALQLNLIGPQQLVMSGNAADITPEQLTEPVTSFQEWLQAMPGNPGIDHQTDPITVRMNNNDALSRVLAVINHNRGYDNDSGEAGGTVLTDSAWRPIVGLNKNGPWEAMDFPQAVKDKAAIIEAKTRILIVSDSTASTYEALRMPRMGWGQVFQQHFKDNSGVVVLNGARAGRSSRDFYNEGWYQQMAQYMQPGDYVFIAHGHNDQNCNSERAVRGAADVKNLCTYPNSPEGKPQYPDGRPDMSFQHSLERYINLAKDADATPVLFTPTTRVRNASGRIAWQNDNDPVVSRHFTPDRTGFLFSGDYIATVKQTAEANKIPLIDLEKETIDLANNNPTTWMDYWLAVDHNDPRYPWYKTQATGILSNPDTTHFQQKGAEAIADIVAAQIRLTPELRELASQLKE